MPTLAIDKGFLSDLVKLERPVAKRVAEVLDEFDTAAVIEGWIDSGIAASEIGLAVRAKWLTTKIDAVLRRNGIATIDLAKASDDDDAVRIGTMHRMKGLEFRCMCDAEVSAKLVPAANAVTPAKDDKQTRQQDVERERCLLFAACTQAREELLVTWHGELSPFVAALERQAT